MEASNFIFKRYSPENKHKFINEMSNKELLRVDESIILRIIKEVGVGLTSKTRNKFKILHLSHYNVGNYRNSNVESIFNGKKDKVYLDIYIQGYDTDCTVECSFNDFITKECLGKFEETYLHGNPQMIYANYSDEHKAIIIKSILLAYIDNKYKL